MALIPETLKAAIFDAFKAQQNKTENPDGALQDLAGKLAAAIDSYIKSGEVVGTCATPAGAGTIKGNVT